MNTAVPLRERVLSAAAATPSMTRRQGRRMAAVLIALSAVLAAAFFIVVSGSAATGDAAFATRGAIVRGWGIAAGSFACVVLGRGRSTVVRSPNLLTAATWASPVVMLLWVLRFDGGHASLDEALTGMALGVAIAATPLASFLLIRRGAEPRYPRVLGGAAGAMFGALAQVVVLFWHPFTSIGYAAVAHAVPLVALAGIGRVAGARTLASAGTRGRRDDSSHKLVGNQGPVSTWSNWKDVES
jgi:hypothetical protein